MRKTESAGTGADGRTRDLAMCSQPEMKGSKDSAMTGWKSSSRSAPGTEVADDSDGSYVAMMADSCFSASCRKSSGPRSAGACWNSPCIVAM